MSNKKQFEADNKVYALMKKIVSEVAEHNHLLEIVDHIAIVMKEVKPPKDPSKPVVVGKTAKAPPVMEALGKQDWKVVITINATVWEMYPPEARKAELDHQLCYIETKYDDDSGETKVSLRKPDVVGFRGELERHGLWREKPGGGTYPSPVEELFEQSDE